MNNNLALWLAFLSLFGGATIVFAGMKSDIAVNSAHAESNKELIIDIRDSLRIIERHVLSTQTK